MSSWEDAPFRRGADAGLAAGVGVLVLGSTYVMGDDGQRPLFPGGALLIVLGALALVWRRRRPIGTLMVTVAAVMSYYVLGYADGSAALLLMIAMYTVAVRVRWPVAAAIGVALLVVWMGTELAVGGMRLSGVIGEHAAWVGCIVAVGVAVGASRRAREVALARFEEQAHREVERERLRIAREVHDVVSHSLVMINVQAGVAVHVADRRPEQVVPALFEIREASRVALADLRATLGVLRDDGSLPAPDTPAPGLHRLDEMVRTGEAAGLEVRVQGDPGPLPVRVESAAFRILQEAVTNVVRHARGAQHLTIGFSRDHGALRLQVRDDGAPSGAHEPGNGLRGIDERAAALGGRVRAARGPDGFVVEAVVPVPAGS